ncbi:hypothetical protein XW81_00360 [Buchnera aphidicola (Schlechtendalia chinensis)]|uniref:Uncharacterized protein n=1 Tax=Buchnera aphidicola subsp. Schlechtendalia chinensis TaxID=118110 RepID=A0A172WD43_BUCSC|nr:hypothetical protein XW81_00360 [Buchnera aphidicola (Schlechtendalia chinensis)]
MSNTINIDSNISYTINERNFNKWFSKKDSELFLKILNKSLIVKKNNIEMYSTNKDNIIKIFSDTFSLVDKIRRKNIFFENKKKTFDLATFL